MMRHRFTVGAVAFAFALSAVVPMRALAGVH